MSLRALSSLHVDDYAFGGPAHSGAGVSFPLVCLRVSNGVPGLPALGAQHVLPRPLRRRREGSRSTRQAQQGGTASAQHAAPATSNAPAGHQPAHPCADSSCARLCLCLSSFLQSGARCTWLALSWLCSRLPSSPTRTHRRPSRRSSNSERTWPQKVNTHTHNRQGRRRRWTRTRQAEDIRTGISR